MDREACLQKLHSEGRKQTERLTQKALDGSCKASESELGDHTEYRGTHCPSKSELARYLKLKAKPKATRPNQGHSHKAQPRRHPDQMYSSRPERCLLLVKMRVLVDADATNKTRRTRPVGLITFLSDILVMVAKDQSSLSTEAGLFTL